MTEAETVDFLRQGSRTGKLSVNLASGRPTITPIWFVHGDDGVIRFTTGSQTPKARALRRDSRACLLVDLEESPYAYVKVDAQAHLVDDPALCLEVATAAGLRYMGPELGEAYGRRNSTPDEIVVELVPVKVTALAGIAD